MLARELGRLRRHRRVRKRVAGTQDRLRFVVYRSCKHIYAQLVNDLSGMTLVSVSTLDKEIRSKVKVGGTVGAAQAVGKRIAELALAKGVKQVTFDRGGYQYHGRVKAIADAAREGGLDF